MSDDDRPDRDRALDALPLHRRSGTAGRELRRRRRERRERLEAPGPYRVRDVLDEYFDPEE